MRRSGQLHMQHIDMGVNETLPSQILCSYFERQERERKQSEYEDGCERVMNFEVF